MPWRRKWETTAIFLPEKFHGQRCLVGYSPWGRKESDKTEHAIQYTPKASSSRDPRKTRFCIDWMMKIWQETGRRPPPCISLGAMVQWSVSAADSGFMATWQNITLYHHISSRFYINNINNTNWLPWSRGSWHRRTKVSSKELRLKYLELSLRPSRVSIHSPGASGQH